MVAESRSMRYINPMELKYSIREIEFCYEYIALKSNGTKAALAIGCSPKSAGRAAFDLLQKPKIRKKIAELTKRHLRPFGYKVEDILSETAICAFSDITNYVDFEGDEVSLKSSDDIIGNSPAIRELTIKPCIVREVQSDGTIETIQGTQVNIKLHDKIKALRMLGDNARCWEQSSDGDGDDYEFSFND